MELPFSDSCERNKRPIREVLKRYLPGRGSILEIGSCTGQHVVFLAPLFPGLTWQPTDRNEYLRGLTDRLNLEGGPNILPAIELDVIGTWPQREFAAAFSANTAHIMSWEAVCAMFRGLGSCISPGGVFCLYGPFNRNGTFSAPSNEEFDRSLRFRDPQMGIRDIADLASLSERHNMVLEEEIGLPANNQVLVFRRNDEAEPDRSD